MHLGRVITSPRCTIGRVNPSSSAFYQSKGRVDGSLDEPMHVAASATPAATKTGENAEGQIVGKATYYTRARPTFFYFSLVLFADNFVQYRPSLPRINQLDSSLPRGAVVQWLARPLVMPAAGVRSPDQAHYYV